MNMIDTARHEITTQLANLFGTESIAEFDFGSQQVVDTGKVEVWTEDNAVHVRGKMNHGKPVAYARIVRTDFADDLAQARYSNKATTDWMNHVYEDQRLNLEDEAQAYGIDVKEVENFTAVTGVLREYFSTEEAAERFPFSLVSVKETTDTYELVFGIKTELLANAPEKAKQALGHGNSIRLGYTIYRSML